MNGEGDGESLVDVDIGDVGEAGGEKVHEQVRRASGADPDGGSGEALEAEPPAADE